MRCRARKAVLKRWSFHQSDFLRGNDTRFIRIRLRDSFPSAPTKQSSMPLLDENTFQNTLSSRRSVSPAPRHSSIIRELGADSVIMASSEGAGRRSWSGGVRSCPVAGFGPEFRDGAAHGCTRAASARSRRGPRHEKQRPLIQASVTQAAVKAFDENILMRFAPARWNAKRPQSGSFIRTQRGLSFRFPYR